jgi:hypothetical protein
MMMTMTPGFGSGRQGSYLADRLGHPLPLLISPNEVRESLSPPLMIKVEVYDCDSGESGGEARRKCPT